MLFVGKHVWVAYWPNKKARGKVDLIDPIYSSQLIWMLQIYRA